MPKYSFFIATIILLVSKYDSVAQHTSPLSLNGEISILCDSIYPNKNYRITLSICESVNEDESIPNTLFSVARLSGGQYITIFSDSIFSKTRNIEFADFNNDKIPDILVQNISDVRSNQTYHLYLVDTVQNKLKKIKGFEVIKNPGYLSQYNLIANYVISGRIWTSFYKIQDDTIKDFDIVVYDNQKEDGSYDRDYKKAVQSILKKKKKGR